MNIKPIGPLDPPQPRRLRFDFAQDCPPDWMAGSLPGSCLMNAYSLVFPALETVMVHHISSAVKSTDRTIDSAAVRGFLQQEGSHAREHRRSLECLRVQGYHVNRLFAFVDWIVAVGIDAMLRRVLRPLFGHSFSVAIFAAAEHWTASLSEMALTSSAHRVSIGRLEQPASASHISEMEALFLWHIAEELEHKCVVADLFDALDGRNASRLAAFFLATPMFLLLTTLSFVVLLAQAPRVLGERDWRETGRWRGLWRWVRHDLADVPRTYRRTITSYLRRGFHPSQHQTDALVARAFSRLHELPHLLPGTSS